MRNPLSEQQENRLVRHLDQQLLQLSGHYESRHAASSPLQSLDTFLDAIVPLLSFILSIPAAPPSADIRIQYLLQLAGFLPAALDGYTLIDDTLPKLFDVLARFDAAFVAVLEGRDWDSSTGQAIDEPTTGGKMRTTDRVRLESLVKETKAVLAVSLGLPEFVPLENDPFQELLRMRDARKEPTRLEELRQPEREQVDAGEGGAEVEMQPASSGMSTPSLVSDSGGDDSDAMLLDTAVATPPPLSASTFDGDDDDASDDEFEEVAVSSAAHLPATSSSVASLSDPTAYADSPSADGSFTLHFTGPPPPTLQDGEVSLLEGQTPIVGQARGFDPDEEYPPEREVGERVGEDGEGESEEEDGIEESTRERVKRVFERAERVLEALRAGAV
ncbi:hypothetical protein JCM10207_003308 [Rhodosporidiobolus poonsookiae]